MCYTRDKREYICQLKINTIRSSNQDFRIFFSHFYLIISIYLIKPTCIPILLSSNEGLCHLRSCSSGLFNYVCHYFNTQNAYLLR